MKRRDFLKLIGIAPIAPKILESTPKKELPKELPIENTLPDFNVIGFCSICESGEPIGFTLKDIPKNKYGWVCVGVTAHYAK